MKAEAERKNIRKYFTELAKHYERNGFLVAAAIIYKRFDKRKSKRLYRILAKQAQMNGLYLLAAEAYKAGGQKKRASRIKYYFGSPDKLTQTLGALIFGPSFSVPIEKILFATTRYEREGQFDKARKHWYRAGRYCEIVGEFRFASLYYFKCGQLREAKRLWRKTAQPRIIVS